MTSAPRLRFGLRPSRALAGWIFGAHAVAGACALLVWPLGTGVLLAVLLCALGAAQAWRQALLRSAASPCVLELAGDGVFAVELRQGTRIDAVASAPRHVTRFWVVLRTGSRSCRTLLVTAGMLDRDEFRRLRVWALWGGVAGATPVAYPA